MRRAFVVESSVSTLSSGLDPYFIPFLSILPIQVVLLIYLLLYLYLIVPMPFYLDEGESSWQYESQYVRERTLVLWRLVALAITGVGFTLGFLKYGPGCLIYGTTYAPSFPWTVKMSDFLFQLGFCSRYCILHA